MFKFFKRKKILIFLLILTFLISVVLIYFNRNVRPIIIEVSKDSVKSITTVAVNDAVYYTMSEALKYEDLISVTRNNEGDIVFMSANSLKINSIARDIAYMSQKNLDKLGSCSIKIPLGAFSGTAAFAGFGPDINLKIIPIGSVYCEFSSVFESMGINQTRHKIYLDVVADVELVIPAASTNVSSKTQVLICESVIVGKVPSTFLNLTTLGGFYDFTAK